MAYNYNTIRSLVNQRYLPKLYDNIFTANHYFLVLLKKKAKIYNEERIRVALEYAKATTIDFLAPYEAIVVRPEEIITSAYYLPKMFSGSLSICLEDELKNKSDLAIKNLLSTKTRNLERSMQGELATYMWTRGATALPDSNGWNTIDYLISDESAVDVGDILSSGTVPAWWKSKVLDLTTEYTGDAQSEDDLKNSTKDVYIKKLLQRGIAKAKYQTGAKPDICLVPQYIWDLIEDVLDPQKTGSKMSERAGKMGFTALDYRGMEIVADDDMVAAQVDDTDGRMYFINTDFLWMYFNSGAKFTADEFVKAHNANSRTALVNAYGNICISNRRSQVEFQNIKSPKSYAA